MGEPVDPGRFAGGDELAAAFEALGGQVQMIYIDPSYGVKFGSNFQPLVRKRDVTVIDEWGNELPVIRRFSAAGRRFLKKKVF